MLAVIDNPNSSGHKLIELDKCQALSSHASCRASSHKPRKLEIHRSPTDKMTTPRLPESSDFPGSLVYKLTPPAKPAQNILILLHGLGDTHEPFAALGTNLNLPETACLSVRGPTPLPFDMNGFHWGDDIIFDQSTGGLDGDSGFGRTRKLLRELLDETLVKKCGWRPRSIFFLGFGQGGMVAVDLPAGNKNVEYGGAVSIGGALPSDSDVGVQPEVKSSTPILLLGAEKNSAIDAAAEERMKERFDFVKVVKWSGRNGDGMMKSREEVRPIMEFFAKRLGSRQGVPEGAVEL